MDTDHNQAGNGGHEERRESKVSWLWSIVECLLYGTELVAWIMLGIVRIVAFVVVGILGSCS